MVKRGYRALDNYAAVRRQRHRAKVKIGRFAIDEVRLDANSELKSAMRLTTMNNLHNTCCSNTCE